MAADPTYRRSDGWPWRAFGGSVLLMHDIPDAVQLDGAAAVVWHALICPGRVDELVARSCSDWASAPEDAESPADLVRDAIWRLVDLGAIEAIPEATESP